MPDNKFWTVMGEFLSSSSSAIHLVTFFGFRCLFASHTKAERQKQLRTEYRFQCKCEACLFDFPLAKDLTERKLIPDDQKVTSMSCDQMIQVLTKNFDQYPCAELVRLQDNIIHHFYEDFIPKTIEFSFK